jgi:hypothetical protein
MMLVLVYVFVLSLLVAAVASALAVSAKHDESDPLTGIDRWRRMRRSFEDEGG